VPVGCGGGHTGPQTGERTRTAAHHDGIHVGHRQPGIGKCGKHIRGEPLGVRPGADGHPFGEHREITALEPY